MDKIYPEIILISPLKIKYSLTHISTAEQTVEKGRKPLKIKGLRHFFSGKDRGKCEKFTPDFGVKRGNFPRFPLSLGKISVEKWTIWWKTHKMGQFSPKK